MPRRKQRRIRPLERSGHYTVLDNILLDGVMKELGANAWKCLCFLIRQTKGWNRETASPDYEEIMNGMGVGSRSTVKKALDELLAWNLILVHKGGRRQPNTYEINEGFEVVLEEDAWGYYKAKNLGPQSGPSMEIRVPLDALEAPRVEDLTGGQTTLGGMRRAMEENAEQGDNPVAAVRAAMRLVFGETNLPEYKEVGGWMKQCGGPAQAIRKCFRYASADVEGNPVHYMAAAEARIRRARRGEDVEDVDAEMPGKPVHLGTYGYDEYRHFLSLGYEKQHFGGAGPDLYRYLDPEKQG